MSLETHDLVREELQRWLARVAGEAGAGVWLVRCLAATRPGHGHVASLLLEGKLRRLRSAPGRGPR